jgi:hypothetical protein
MSSNPNVLAREMLATADALRHLRHQVAFLIQSGTLVRVEDENVETIMVHALAVADALEAVASKVASIGGP